jgi:predicted acylesterase/phospholipase RssA
MSEISETKKIKLRIMLPGGGSKGSFQLGFISEILQSGKYMIDAVYGTSIGAILSPFISNEEPQPLIDLFNNIKSIDDIMEPRKILGFPIRNQLILGLYSFLYLGAYKSIVLVDKMLALLSPEQLKIAQKRCHVVSYDILNNEEKWFTGSELEIGIKCSSALWLAVPPINYNNGLYTDGGVTEVFPVDYILQHEIDTKFDGVYLFIDCDARLPYKNEVPTNGLSMMNDLHWGASLRLSDFELAKLQSALNNTIIIIKPDNNYLNGSLDIDQIRMKKTFIAGALKGQEFLNST